MAKRLILSVSCANDLSSDVPSLFTIAIGDELAERIAKLSEAVWSVGASEISDSNYDGVWSCADIEAPDVGAELGPVVDALEQGGVAVDISELHVTEREFYFTAIPKCGSDGVRLSTKPLRVSDLEDDDTVILAD